MTNESARSTESAKEATAAWQPVKGPGEDGWSGVKCYYAPSVEEAMSKARAEIGPDAMLLRSRTAPIEFRHLGTYEVVFSLSVHAPPQKAAAAGLTDAAGGPQPSDMKMAREFAEMRRQMQMIQRALAIGPEAEAAPGQTLGEAHQEMAARLRQIGFDDEIAAHLMAQLPADLAAQPPAAAESALRGQLTGQLRFPAPHTGHRLTAPIVTLVGPPGAGKTTTLAKLALLRSQTASRPIHFISADWHRVGAAEQLRTYASILSASIDLVDSPRLLAQALEANREKDTILIDTPGLSGGEFEMLNDLADFLGKRDEIEKHLILPATMRFRDLQRCIRRYEIFQPGRLLFTHLDETDSFGPLCSAALWYGRPLSFLSGGQQIPEDLEEATPDTLMRLLFREECAEAPAGERL